MCPACMLYARAHSLGAIARAKKSDGLPTARCSLAAQLGDWHLMEHDVRCRHPCSHFLRELAHLEGLSGLYVVGM